MVSVLDATPDRWPDVVTVMGTRGDPSRCWCQFFRIPGAGWDKADAPAMRDALHQQVRGAVPPGVLAFYDGEPIGWCAVAPRASYARLGRSTVATATDDGPGVWAVTCFVVRVGHRRRGVAAALLDGAVDLARRHGASTVEGYPVDTAVRKASSAELYHGPLSVFRAAGFTEVARPSAARAVVRRELRYVRERADEPR